MSTLVDTDILIDYSRQIQPALEFIADLEEPFSISVLTLVELKFGIRTKVEAEQFRIMFSVIRSHDVTREIAELAANYRVRFGRSHGSGIIDCLIAATAQHHGLRLATRNRKHFPMVTDLLVPYVI